MTAKQIELMDELSLRMEQIVSIGAMQNTGSLATPLKECLGFMAPATLEALFPTEAEFLADYEDESNVDRFAALVAERLLFARKDGYLVEYGTPIITDGSYSWGHYTTEWFYGETVEDTFAAAVTWTEQTRACEKTKERLAKMSGFTLVELVVVVFGVAVAALILLPLLLEVLGKK